MIYKFLLIKFANALVIALLTVHCAKVKNKNNTPDEPSISSFDHGSEAADVVDASLDLTTSVAATTCSPKPAIAVFCGAAGGACKSSAEVTQMARVISGLPIQIVRVDWGGATFQQKIAVGHRVLNQLKCSGTRKVLFAGRSAGGHLAGIIGTFPDTNTGHSLDGVIGFYGVYDGAALWQRSQWGKKNSPRGPMLASHPAWGFPGCTACSMPFPQGDTWYYNMNDASDPKTDRHIKDLISEDPYSHVTAATPPFFMTQGTEDGIIGAYHGISQAERMFHRLGDRAQDQLLICPGYEHGFAFDAPCTITALRSWIVKTLGL